MEIVTQLSHILTEILSLTFRFLLTDHGFVVFELKPNSSFGSERVEEKSI